jgi:hypothetical protein
MSWPTDEHQHFVKVADGPEASERRHAEAQILRYVAHPGVVQLLGEGPVEPDGWELTLSRVDGGTLGEQQPWSSTEEAGFASALATTVADLHDLGVVHGQLTDDHVLVDPQGRPIICGFGSANRLPENAAGGQERARDVADLAEMISDRLGNATPRPVRKLLDRARDPDTRRPVTARQLASVLERGVAGCRLPDMGARAPEPTAVERSQGHPEPGAPPRRRVMGIGLVMGAATVVAILATFHHQASTARSANVSPARCPAVDLGCRPLAPHNGVVVTSTGHYRLGGRGDVVVLGRWTCQAQALPAELQLGSGRVWVFPTWATAGHPATARLVTTVSDARSLAVQPERSGCDQLDVLRSHGRKVIALRR